MTATWLDIVNLVLAGLALGGVLWGLRQRAVLQRVEKGLVQLRSGRPAQPLVRRPEDAEPILHAYDELLRQIRQESQERSPSTNGPDIGQVLGNLCAALRNPLRNVQDQVSELDQDPTLALTSRQRDCLVGIRQQVQGIMRLLEGPGDLANPPFAANGPERASDGLAAAAPLRPPCVLVLDEENSFTESLVNELASAGVWPVVAPSHSAVAALARTLSPAAVLANASWSGGRAWSILEGLGQVASPRLYARTGDAQVKGWVPTEIWFWPAESQAARFAERWSERSSGLHFSVHGLPELVEEVSRVLERMGFPLAHDGEPAVTLDPCATILVLADAEEEARAIERAHILVVPASLARERPAELATAFLESAWLRPLPEAQARARLVEGLLASSPAKEAPAP